MDINNNLWWSTIVLKGKEERSNNRRTLQYTVCTFSVVQYSTPYTTITSIQYYNTMAMYSTWIYR